MSFGFSVGDFIAVGQLIKDIVGSLQDAGGAKSEFQELLRELESLQHALQHLDKLPQSASSLYLESIKFTALSCRQPLEEFLNKVKKYERSLGVWAQAKTTKRTADKLRWSFGYKDEIRKLQSYLNLHIGSINMLLAVYGLEKVDIASNKAQEDQWHIRERLEDTHNIIKNIESNSKDQAFAIRATDSMLRRLFEMVGGQFSISLKSFGEMIAKVSVSTQQIYCMVLEIRSSLAPVDPRWTFFQAPFVVEDALGFKFPVPSEYDFGLLNAVITHRFRDGPGSQEVSCDDYELVNSKSRSEVLSADVKLLPGTSITMAILIGKATLSDEMCPLSQCGSRQTTMAPGGGRLCCKCNVWFDSSSKKKRLFAELLDAADGPVGDSSIEESLSDRPRKRPRIFRDENSSTAFKNVRLATDMSDSNIVSESIPESPITFDYALAYVDKVKDGVPNDVYREFLHILSEYQDKKLDLASTHKKVVSLLRGSSDLIEGFCQFVPNYMTIAGDVYSESTRNSEVQIQDWPSHEPVEGDLQREQ